MRKKLLIVDDEWIIADSIRSLDEWEERNIEVVGTASNGREAMEWIEREPIDLVITDIRMPDMDGLELLRSMHRLKPEIQVIVISGYEEFAYARTALMYQARGYVLKPIDIDELLSIVDTILAEAESPAAPSVPSAADQDSPRTYREAIVKKAMEYVELHLAKLISLKDMAAEVHLTPHYFGQLFKAETGETFIAYQTRMRMEKAAELLKDPMLKVYEVGTMVGYQDTKYFTKVFFKTYGLTPKEYKASP